MTDNGRTGPSPQVLAAMRGEDPYGQIPQPSGPYAPTQKRGFTAGETWDGAWDFTHYEGGEKGDTPMPNQERIGIFRRRLSEFSVEAQRLFHEAQKADAKAKDERRKAAEKAYAEGKDYVEPFSAKKAIKEMEDAEAEDKRLHGLLREHMAEFCAGSPTLQQLNVLPDHEAMRFANYLAEQISPEG